MVPSGSSIWDSRCNDSLPNYPQTCITNYCKTGEYMNNCNYLPLRNLSGVDLSNTDLHKANFRGDDLSGTNFSNADLTNANLSGASLSGANLSGASLYGANLSGADLTDADLTNVDLSNTVLYNAANIPFRNFDLQKKLNQYWYCLIGDYSGPNNPDCVKYDERHVVGISPTEITSYQIEKDSTLTIVYEDSDMSKKLEIFRDQKLHQHLWDMYTSITPPEILSELIYFVVYTDDYGGEVALVSRDTDNPLKFYLSVDPVDVGPSGIKLDKQFYVSTLIHENAHILSLNENQGDNKSLSEDDASTPETYKQQMKNAEYSCAPNYYNDLAGCMKESSYLNAFYQEFWAEIYHDFKWALEFDDYETFSEHNTEFYLKYQKYWLTVYSSENPDEDFAESFMAFVLKEKPSAPTFAEQKILFFYQYPELVEMRDFIRSSIATSEFCNNDNVWKDQKCRQPVPATPQQQPTPQQQSQQSENGGCLIATATYGSEMANEVQQLRELRDNQLLQTESGTAFIIAFNDIYYSFSPVIADYERENPYFKEAVKLAITPMISSLSLMENANSESEVISLGLSVIALNLGMYLGVPAIVVVGIRKIK